MNRLWLILLFLLGSCVTSNNTTSETTLNIRYDSIIYTPKYAKRFNILQRGKDTIIIKIIKPLKNSEKTDKIYHITKPYSRIIAMSTSYLSFLSALQYEEHVIGVSGKNYIYSDKYNKATDVGYDRNLEFEKIIALKPDVMFVYDIGGESNTTINKIESCGINTIYIADYLEESPLGRAEWIVAFGAMIGKIDEAISYFNDVETRYNNISSSTQGMNVKVMINSPYKNIWYMPGCDSYPVKLIQDAGGTYIGEQYKGNQSYPINIETAYSLLQKADIWINPSIGVNSVSDIVSQNPILNNCHLPYLFNNNKRTTQYGGTDYYEYGVTRPDLILKDLYLIFKYKENVSSNELFFYRKLQ